MARLSFQIVSVLAILVLSQYSLNSLVLNTNAALVNFMIASSVVSHLFLLASLPCSRLSFIVPFIHTISPPTSFPSCHACSSPFFSFFPFSLTLLRQSRESQTLQ